MKTTFETIAQKRNGELEITKQKFRKHGYVSIQNKYELKIIYNNHEILIENEFGFHNLGLVKCIFPIRQNFEFESVERGYFSKIFNSKSDFISIKSDSSRIKNYIENQPSFKKLNELAKADRFEPLIIGKNTEHGFEVTTKYWLMFDTREEVIEPLIDFYEMLIEYLK